MSVHASRLVEPLTHVEGHVVLRRGDQLEVELFLPSGADVVRQIPVTHLSEQDQARVRANSRLQWTLWWSADGGVPVSRIALDEVASVAEGIPGEQRQAARYDPDRSVSERQALFRDDLWRDRLSHRAEHAVFRQEVMAAAGESWSRIRDEILEFDAGRVGRLLAERPELQAQWDEDEAVDAAEAADEGYVGAAPYTAADAALADRLRARDRLLDEVFLNEVARSSTAGVRRMDADLRVSVGRGQIDYMRPGARVRDAVRHGVAAVDLSLTHEQPGRDRDLNVALPIAALPPSESRLLRDRSTVTLVQLTRDGHREAVEQSWRARTSPRISRDELAVAAVSAAAWGELFLSPVQSPVTEQNPHAQQLLARVQAVRDAYPAGPALGVNRPAAHQPNRHR